MERIGRKRSAHARCWVLKDRSKDCTSGPALLPAEPERSRYRPYFENYTVDASILDLRLRSQVYMVNDAGSRARINHWSISQRVTSVTHCAIDSKLM